jgi:hypothetical protein
VACVVSCNNSFAKFAPMPKPLVFDFGDIDLTEVIYGNPQFGPDDAQGS